MKQFGVALSWAIFLVVAGVFLLLKNLGVLGQWGELVWGGLYALAGLGFLVWFLFDFTRWWRVLPGFTLLSVGALLLAQWRGIALGDWKSALVILGIALGFWLILLVKKENWWAVIPAGVLTVVGVLMGLEAQMSEFDWLAVLFFGLGLVFVLLYVMRLGQADTRWAAIPAAALILLGLVTLLSSINAPAVIEDWWPVLLVVGGVGLSIGLLGRRQPNAAPVALPDFDEIVPAPGASKSEFVPATVPEPLSLPAVEATSGEEDVDIYSVLARQPEPDIVREEAVERAASVPEPTPEEASRGEELTPVVQDEVTLDVDDLSPEDTDSPIIQA